MYPTTDGSRSARLARTTDPPGTTHNDISIVVHFCRHLCHPQNDGSRNFCVGVRATSSVTDEQGRKEQAENCRYMFCKRCIFTFSPPCEVQCKNKDNATTKKTATEYLPASERAKAPPAVAEKLSNRPTKYINQQTSNEYVGGY